MLFAIIVSRPLADDGFVLTFPIVTLIAVTVLAAIAGVLAAIPPARRASQGRRAARRDDRSDLRRHRRSATVSRLVVALPARSVALVGRRA